MILRDYQTDVIAGVQAAYQTGSRSVLMQLPTGGGKTATVVTGFIAPSIKHGRRFLFCAHLEELLDDTASRLTAAGLACGVIKSGRPRTSAPVQVASTPTLARMLERGDAMPSADRVILDEAHRAAAAQNRAILAHYRGQGALLLGLSATPSRGDDRPLDEFEALVTGPTMRRLIADGHLVQPTVYAPARILDKGVAEDPVDLVLGRARDRRCVIFAPTGADATTIAERLTAAGHPTEAILDGTDHDVRRSVRDRLADGSTRHVVTVRALLEGWDCPVLDCAVLCGAFTTIAPFLQAIGRVLRPHHDKRDAWIFDLRGAVYLHGLPEDDRAWTLAGAQGRVVGEAPISLRRCKACHAVFPPVTRCPRCGALSVGDPRPMRVQRAELWSQSTVSPRERAEVYINGAVRAMRSRKPSLSEQWARSTAAAKAPAWVKEALRGS